MKKSASMLEPMWSGLACRKPLVSRRHHSPEAHHRAPERVVPVDRALHRLRAGRRAAVHDVDDVVARALQEVDERR